jgi:orotate phosphoribosyltransferase
LSATTSARGRLLELLKSLSWHRGRVRLSSGKESDFYIDCKQTALNAEGAALVGELVFAHDQTLRGADPIAAAAAVVSYERGAPVHGFIIRKEPKAHGTAQWLEGAKSLPQGSPVLLVEDVVTSGASTLKALERARDSGLVPVALLSLVDREEGGRETLAATGLPYASLFRRADFL